VKTHRHLLLAASLLGPIAMVQPATMTAQKIEFRNINRYRVQACAYDQADRVYQLIALECWTLNKDQTVTWDRGKDTSPFHLRLFNPQTGETLCYRTDIPGDVLGIEIAYDPCGISLLTKGKGPAPSPAPKPPLESVLTVCNTSVREKVNFAIAYVVDVSEGEGSTHVVAEGWWGVSKGECKGIPLRARMEKWRNPALPNTVTIYPSFFIYGETEGFLGGAIKRVMEGDESDPNDISVCIDRASNFEYRQQPTNAPAFHLTERKECADKRIRMAKVTRHSDDLSEFYWTF
jgi:hypothetical protein